MFIVEQAHWYYEDHCRDADPSLPSLSLRVFAHSLAAHCPDAFSTAFGKRGNQQQTTALIHDIDAAMAQFNAFKARVPTAGAALLDPTLTKVLMVKGYKKDASWGFPRGKLSKGETASECAAREVLEETGIDISGLVDDGASPRIEVDVGSQATTLFIVAGAASEETPVAALVRGEIGDIAWHLLADLPSTRDAGLLTYKTAAGVKHRFWRVSVFLFFFGPMCSEIQLAFFFTYILSFSSLRFLFTGVALHQAAEAVGEVAAKGRRRGRRSSRRRASDRNSTKGEEATGEKEQVKRRPRPCRRRRRRRRPFDVQSYDIRVSGEEGQGRFDKAAAPAERARAEEDPGARRRGGAPSRRGGGGGGGGAGARESVDRLLLRRGPDPRGAARIRREGERENAFVFDNLYSKDEKRKRRRRRSRLQKRK